MTEECICLLISDYAARYPALIDLAQAAEISGRPLGTLHNWSSQGRFDVFKAKVGKRVQLCRDAFVRFIAGGGEGSADVAQPRRRNC